MSLKSSWNLRPKWWVYRFLLKIYFVKLLFSFKQLLLLSAVPCDAFALLFTQRLIYDVHETTSIGLIFPFLRIHVRMRWKVRAACIEWRLHFTAAAATTTTAPTAIIITGQTRFMPFHSTQLLISFSVSFTFSMCAMCTILYVHVFVSKRASDCVCMWYLSGMGWVVGIIFPQLFFLFISSSRRSFYLFHASSIHSNIECVENYRQMVFSYVFCYCFCFCLLLLLQHILVVSWINLQHNWKWKCFFCLRRMH